MASNFTVIYLINRYAVGRWKTDFFTAVGLRSGDRSLLAMVLYPAILGLGMALLIMLIETVRGPTPPSPLGQIMSQSTLIWHVLFMSTIVLLAAPMEEIIFRGYLFPLISRCKGETFAILVITGIFSILHVEQNWGDWTAIAVITLLGLSITVLRARLGTTVPGLSLHYAYNLTLFLLPMVLLLFTNPILLKYSMYRRVVSPGRQEQILLQSIDRYPDDTRAYNALARLYAAQEENLLSALDIINNALSLDPENISYLDTKAEVLYQMKYFSEALSLEEEMIKRFPHSNYLKEQADKYRNAVWAEAIRARQERQREERRKQ